MPIQRRKKGVKGQPGTPTTEYGELKSNVKMTLTPTAVATLDRIATALSVSRSELTERIARAGDEAIMKLLREKTQDE
jgi:hypothetical protein